jgi:hypothetical protein
VQDDTSPRQTRQPIILCFPISFRPRAHNVLTHYCAAQPFRRSWQRKSLKKRSLGRGGRFTYLEHVSSLFFFSRASAMRYLYFLLGSTVTVITGLATRLRLRTRGPEGLTRKRRRFLKQKRLASWCELPRRSSHFRSFLYGLAPRAIMWP